MSEFTQPGQHPEADQLSAFAEDALSAHEREQTLAHLAGCAGCRMIVSLALPPAEDVPQLQPAAAHRPWFYGWNIAWLAGAGLAALIFLTAHVHNSGRDAKIVGGTPTQTAEVHTTAPPQAPPTEPPVSNAAPLPARTIAPAVAAPLPADSGEALKSATAGGMINGQDNVNLPAQGRRFIVRPQQGQMTQQQQSQQQSEALHGSLFGAGTGGVARNNLSPFVQNNALNNNYQNAAGAPATAPAPAAPPPVMSARAQPAPVLTAKSAPQTAYGLDVISDDAQMVTTNAAPSTIIAPGASVDLHKLPSHLAIASTITRGGQMLALDTAGALFLSTNGGHHWKTVSAPWPGRAVKVELASLPVPAKQPPSSYPDGNASGSALSALDMGPLAGPSVAGVVTDRVGATIPGVLIKLTGTRTGTVRTAISDRSGRYAVGGLAPDVYRMDASMPGFDSQRTTVTLTAAQQSVVNISLKVGAVSETVEVSAASPTLDAKEKKRMRRADKDTSLSEPSAIFAITTDGGEIWTSADGKNWKRK